MTIPNLKSCLIILILLLNSSAKAQFWKDIGNAVGDIGKTGWKVTTAPYQAIKNTADVVTGNGNIQQIYKPYQQAVNQAGQTIGSTTRAIVNPQQDLYNEAQKFASKLGGPSEFIFDITTFTNRYFNELGYSSGQYLANVLQGQNPLQVNALPLAAALRSARERFAQNARPIPEDVRNALRGKFSDETLNRAKYAIGKVEITLPNLFNFLNVNVANAGNHAVTVGDIIVFAKDPGSYEGSTCHWTHEMVHVDQYRNWGFEEFAWKYINTYPIEKEANQRASSITGFECINGTETPFGIAGGSSSGSSNRPILVNLQTSEVFVAQCFFYNNQYPAYYLITNTSKIISVNIYNNFQQHIGFATPPLNQMFAWDFATPNYRYAVATDGKIWASVQVFDTWGRPVFDYYGRPVMQDQVIGYVQRFQ